MIDTAKIRNEISASRDMVSGSLEECVDEIDRLRAMLEDGDQPRQGAAMTKRKVEAWVRVDSQGRPQSASVSPHGLLKPLPGERIVHLTERDPAAEAALKELLRWADTLRPLPTTTHLAVERYQKSRKR